MIVPAAGAGSSMSTLSVEISTTVSPSSTASPTLTRPLEDRALGDRLAARGRDDVDDLAGAVRRAAASAAGGAARRRRRCRRRRCRAPPSGGDLGEHRADGDGVALGGVDLDDGAGGGRGDLGVDLVGRDLDEGLVGLDGVALLLVPLEDGALGHRLAHRRQRDLNCGGDGHLSTLRPTLARLLRRCGRCIGAPTGAVAPALLADELPAPDERRRSRRARRPRTPSRSGMTRARSAAQDQQRHADPADAVRQAERPSPAPASPGTSQTTSSADVDRRVGERQRLERRNERLERASRLAPAEQRRHAPQRLVGLGAASRSTSAGHHA